MPIRRAGLAVAVLGLALVGVWRWSGTATAPPSAPAPPAPPAVPPPSLPAGTPPVRAAVPPAGLGRRILERARAARAEHPLSGDETRFEWESRTGRREARLFALAHPDEAFPVAAALAQDATADVEDRRLGLYILHFLARQGRREAATLLYALASDPDENVAEGALSGLGDADVRGEHRALYWARLEAGSTTALEIVSRWADPGTASRLREMTASPERRSGAERGLERLEALGSPSLGENLGEILRDRSGARPLDFFWALSVARQRPFPAVVQALRERVNQGVDRAALVWSRRSPAEPLPDFEADLVRSEAFAESTGDAFFDDALVALHELGGALQPRETARLRAFGYACDPAVRLRDLLESR